MRPKFILGLLSLVLLILCAALFLKQHVGNVSAPAPASPEIAIPAPAEAANLAASLPPPPAALPPVPAAPAAANALTDEQRQAAIEAETDRLRQWSLNDDSASLSNILTDLTNPEKEIRDVAIDAAREFGSTNAIPVLKAVAASTADTEEQIALLEAAHALSLPSLDFSGPAVPPSPEQFQADALRHAQRDPQPPNPSDLPPAGQDLPAPPNNN